MTLPKDLQKYCRKRILWNLLWYVVVAQATAWKRCPKLKKEKSLGT
jgi:hypothetical protein